MSLNEHFATGANSHKYSFEWGYQHPVNGGSVIAREEGGKEVGRLRIEPRDDAPINGIQHHGIHVNVDVEHQRRGVATGMVNFARTVFPHLRHQNIRTDDAEGWAQSLDLPAPPRMEVSDIKWRLGPGQSV